MFPQDSFSASATIVESENKFFKITDKPPFLSVHTKT